MKLMGDNDDAAETSRNTMHGLLHGILCTDLHPNKQQIEEVNILLVAWHMFEAWLPATVGYAHRLPAAQASLAQFLMAV